VYEADPFELDGHMVLFVDNPGFKDVARSDVGNFRMIAEFLADQ
jgi:hypothetical protein